MQFAENLNCVSDLFSRILKSIKKTAKDLWHGASLELYRAMILSLGTSGVPDP